MNPSNAKTSATADREIVITRTFDAPRELVFKLWTTPEHVARWWGPRGFTTTIYEMDVRPGGTWRLNMRGPDGTNYKNRIVFEEVVRPERLVYKHTPEHGSEPVNFSTTVTFDDQNGKTTVTLHMMFPTAEQRNYVVEHHGAIEGGKQTLARLSQHIDAEKIDKEVVITRTIDAPRELVFSAWVDPERMKHWWGPTGFTNPVCELDARPGGAIRIDMRAPDGVVYPMTGVYLEVVPPERLVFTSAALDKDGTAMFENLNTVTFEKHGAQTKLTLHGRVVLTTDEATPYLAGMQQGWEMTLDRLAEDCVYSNR